MQIETNNSVIQNPKPARRTISPKTAKIQNRIWAYLQLMRPANILTAWADILAGFAAAGASNLELLLWLLLATTGLYGGGIVFNDVFDAQLDAQERPERPIPSGRASRQGAIILGSLLLVMGISAAVQASLISAFLATVVAFAALIYDAWGKRHPVSSSLNMGLCRGGNFLLGMSAVPELLSARWYLAFIPLVYIAAVTAISQGEVRGGKRSTGILALVLLVMVLYGLSVLGFSDDYTFLAALPFWVLFAGRVFPSWIQATRDPSAEFIRGAVKAGVLSLILLDATIAAGFADIVNGLLILSLLPISMFLAKQFAVT
jgi:4-hydroxybenzoate polyprenyltransferase